MMTLRKSFLSKMVIAALLGAQISGPVKAADGDPHNSHPNTHQPSHHSEIYYGDAPAPHHGGQFHSGYSGGHYDYTYYQITKEHIADFEKKLIANPHSAMEQLAAVANKGFSNTGNGIAQLNIQIAYDTNLPVGKTANISLAPNTNDKVTLLLTIHPAAKTNPYFLLDAIVELNAMYDVMSGYSVTDYKPIYHPHKAHPSHHHGPIVNYHYIEYSLQKTLGIPQETFDGHYGHTGFNPSAPSLSAMEYLEVEANAKGGSIFAQRRLAELEIKKFQILKKGFSTFSLIGKASPDAQKKSLLEYAKVKGVALNPQDSYEVSRKKLIDQVDLTNKKKVDVLNAQAKNTYKKQVQDYKAGAAEREVVVKTKSLPEMLKANDREGVAQAMEKMLPWSIMEPTEKSFWTDFVDSIRHPNYDNATILFRGLDADEKLQAVQDKNGKTVSGALLSKRLTAGSGSHLFKLKGLPETFETFGTTGVSSRKRVSPLTEPHTLTKMMLNHAGNPAGSPFISLSYDLRVAHNFAAGKQIEVETEADIEKMKAKYIQSNQSGGLATIRIDPRRLIINSVSGFTGELEVLASMFVFPDEVIYLEKGVKYSAMIKSAPADQWEQKYKHIAITPEEYYARARQAVLEKTGIVMPEDYNDIREVGTKQFKVGINNMENLFAKVSGHKFVRCEGVFK